MIILNEKAFDLENPRAFNSVKREKSCFDI